MLNIKNHTVVGNGLPCMIFQMVAMKIQIYRCVEESAMFGTLLVLDSPL